MSRLTGDWTSLTEEIKLPSDLMPAMASGRPELFKLWSARALTEAEAVHVVNALRVMVETNQEMQRRLQLLELRAIEMQKNVGGLITQVANMASICNTGKEPGKDMEHG